MKTNTFIIIFMMYLLPDAMAFQVEVNKYPTVPAKSGEQCLVCGVELTNEDVALIVKGRRVPLNSKMVDEFLQNEEKYFRKLQPRGALFQEAYNKEGILSAVSTGWFLIGLWILSSLLTAGLSGYNAISKGLPAVPGFFTGLFLNIIGLIIILKKKPVANITGGLVKIPETPSPVYCPDCRTENHPSAKVCQGCKKELTPVYESEVARVSQK